jgi:hypothetical protein
MLSDNANVTIQMANWDANATIQSGQPDVFKLKHEKAFRNF